jgi:hypothetical protein
MNKLKSWWEGHIPADPDPVDYDLSIEERRKIRRQYSDNWDATYRQPGKSKIKYAFRKFQSAITELIFLPGTLPIGLLGWLYEKRTGRDFIGGPGGYPPYVILVVVTTALFYLLLALAIWMW